MNTTQNNIVGAAPAGVAGRTTPRNDDERAAAQFFADNPGAALLAWPLYLARDKSPALEAPAAPAAPEYIEGGRESVDDALAIVESFGTGIEGLNDEFARQIILAAEVRRLRGLYEQAVNGRSVFRDAYRKVREAVLPPLGCPACDITHAAKDCPQESALAAAPSALATQVVESLLQLARIVNTAVEDWGESFEDGSSKVTFHKEEADKLEEILEFFDSLPDAPPEEGVILSGPSRAARVLRAMAAPAAPVVDAGDQVLGEWPRVSGVGRDAESPRTLLLYLQTEASDDELRAIHDALLDGGALATHALSELMHIGYRVEGGKLVPPENLSVRASEFFGVTAVAAKATAVHSDDVAVDRFAVEMKAKLAAARAKGRGGWETCPPEVLSRMLREHADKGDPRDVANFCMFLWSLGQPISVAAPAAPAVDAQAHDWRENASYGGEICAECGAAKGSRRGNAPCAWPPEPLDVCTDPYNCARCKAHPNHRGGLEHAGISRPRSAAQAKEGGAAC